MLLLGNGDGQEHNGDHCGEALQFTGKKLQNNLMLQLKLNYKQD